MFVVSAVQWGLWSIVYHYGLASTSVGCPSKCVCRPDTTEINCSGKHLTSVPEGFSFDTKRLNLSHNKLKTLGSRQFFGLTQLQELDLSDNVISMIEVDAFQGLHNLVALCIRNNQLKIIPVGFFSGLASLRILNLSKNEILVFLDSTFSEMRNLQILDAGENELVFISQKAFIGLQNLQELNLEHSNLTSIPTEALCHLQSLTHLRMLSFSISSLPNTAFCGLSRLRNLLISSWLALDTLASNSLIGLNLTSLVISRCNLSTVPYVALRHLVYLHYLDLSNNPITVIQGNLLGDLLRLQEFHLAGGRLLRIEPGAFRGLAYFHTLNVTSNQLNTLEESVFHSVGNLQVLRLDRNPLACDCRLLWVVRRQVYLNFDKHQPTCSSPDVAQERDFQDFSETELPRMFTCKPAQLLDRRSQEATVEEGTTVLFSCKADGDPAPSITWISSSKTMLSSTGRIRVLSDGTLEVRYAQAQDSGKYQCIAVNAAGNDSLLVSLQVKGFPRNHTIPLSTEDGWTKSLHPPTANASALLGNPYPFDTKTLMIASSMGFLSFLSSVAICFLFIFFWSQSKGQIKHTATINFVPRTSTGGGGDGADSGRFTMKII
ncbi:leucine-rich repeat and immunoglobulin-like domain-containing nogo receptor-interacting protein 4b [Aplochiton taeniatus]